MLAALGRGKKVRINDLHVDSGVGRALWVGIWGPINLICAFGPLMTLNLLQFPSLALLPFSKKVFRTYQRVAAFLVWGWWAWAVQKVIGLKVHYSGDDVPERENTIVICNHQGMGDILVLLCLAFQKKRISDLKWVAKDALKYVPGLGWGMLFLECIFIKRAWAKDQGRIVKAFNKYKEAQMPVWMMIFPEGTRYKPAKLALSQAYAEKAGIKPLRHVLLPRPKGFYTAVCGLRDYVDAVYSITIGYKGKVPSLVSLIRGDVKDVYCHVRRTDIRTMPKDEKAVGEWLVDAFRTKDELLDGFYARGSFHEH